MTSWSQRTGIQTWPNNEWKAGKCPSLQRARPNQVEVGHQEGEFVLFEIQKTHSEWKTESSCNCNKSNPGFSWFRKSMRQSLNQRNNQSWQTYFCHEESYFNLHKPPPCRLKWYLSSALVAVTMFLKLFTTNCTNWSWDWMKLAYLTCSSSVMLSFVTICSHFVASLPPRNSSKLMTCCNRGCLSGALRQKPHTTRGKCWLLFRPAQAVQIAADRTWYANQGKRFRGLLRLLRGWYDWKQLNCIVMQSARHWEPGVFLQHLFGASSCFGSSFGGVDHGKTRNASDHLQTPQDWIRIYISRYWDNLIFTLLRVWQHRISLHFHSERALL